MLLISGRPGLTRIEPDRWRQKTVAAWKRDDEIWLQHRVWQNADVVMLARVEARPETTIEASGEIMSVRDVALVPVRWLKGAGAPDMFRIGPREMNSCRLEPFFDAMTGEPGNVFVVYVGGGPPSHETVRDALAIPKILEPWALAALRQDQ